MFTTKQITRISILACISAILLMLKFPLGFFPSFLKFEFSYIPCLLCGFAIGPLPGAMCVIITAILNLIIEGGTNTAYIGELSNMLVSLSFVLPSAVIYKKYHIKKGAIISLIISTIICAFVSFFLNYFLLIPSYVIFAKIPLDTIINMGREIIPLIDSKFKLVLFSVVPFNIFKCVINSIIIVLLYKRISPLLKEK